jgi:TadE-like protein
MKRSRGQSLVEFAILSPVLLLLVMGLLDLGRAYYFEVVTTDAARDAARYGVGFPANAAPVGYGQSAMCDQVKSDLIDIISPSSVTCVYRPDLPAAGRPYYTTDYTPKNPGEAIVVIACPPSTNGCTRSTNGQVLNTNIGVTVYYQFAMTTPGMSALFGSQLTFQNSAVFTSLW